MSEVLFDVLFASIVLLYVSFVSIVLFYVLFVSIVLFDVLFVSIVLFYVLFVSTVFFYVLFVCKRVLYYCHRLATQLQLNISYRIKMSLLEAVGERDTTPIQNTILTIQPNSSTCRFNSVGPITNT